MDIGSIKNTWHHGIILSYMSIYSDLQHQNLKWNTSSTTNQQWSTRREAAVMSEACDLSCWQHPPCKHTKVWQLGIFPLSNLLPLYCYEHEKMYLWCITRYWYNWCITDCVVQKLLIFTSFTASFLARPKALEIEAKEKKQWSSLVRLQMMCILFRYTHNIHIIYTIVSWNTMFFIDL